MIDFSRTWKDKPRERFYFRQRYRNRVYNALLSFIEKEIELTGVSRKEIAKKLGKDPSQISRLLSGSSNLTLDTVSDLLYALDAEAEPPQIRRFADKPQPNYVNPLIADIIGKERKSGAAAAESSTVGTSDSVQASLTHKECRAAYSS